MNGVAAASFLLDILFGLVSCMHLNSHVLETLVETRPSVEMERSSRVDITREGQCCFCSSRLLFLAAFTSLIIDQWDQQ